MVGADKDRLLRHRVGRDPDAHRRAGLRHGARDGRMLGAERGDIGEVVKGERHVEVDDADDRDDGDGRVGGEIVGAEQVLFLAGVGDEQDGARRAAAAGDELARRLEHGRDPGGIVERAIVDVVLAGPGVGLDPEMVEVGHEDDVFEGADRVGAGEAADHFGAGEVGPGGVGDDRCAGI